MIDFNDFLKVEMHTGTVLEVKDFAKARKPAFQLWIDFGPVIGIKKTSAQITARYTKEELLGKKVVAVTNFPPKQIADFISEVLILGAVAPDGEVTLLSPDKDVENGFRIS
jgi:tRNA-binding protein